MQRTYRIVIGVMGASRCDEATYEMARRVGVLIAQRGAVLLCGGRGGVMEAVARGAKEAGGLTIGILPGMNASETPPNPYIDVAIFTGLRDGRNWVKRVCQRCDYRRVRGLRHVVGDRACAEGGQAGGAGALMGAASARSCAAIRRPNPRGGGGDSVSRDW
jgi:hypothetical protein